MLRAQTKVWVTHTTLPPRFKALSGLSLKPYLGRHYYVNQLNNALVTVARREGLQLVDYEQVRQARRRGWAARGRRAGGGSVCARACACRFVH